MSHIVSIVYRPEHLEARPADHFTRVPLERAQLIEQYGIEGDLKGGHPERNLNVMAAEMLAELHAEGYQTGPGQMGEQIVVSGVALERLQPGDKLHLGTACIEMTRPRTGCDRFEAIQHLPRASGRMGILARVLVGGRIEVGDAVRVELVAHEQTDS
jgi:MOSC domain-containing protein YiiM